MDNRKWLYIIVVVTSVLFLYRIRVVLTPFFFASIIAYIAYPLMEVFVQREVPRSTAIILVYLVIGVIVGVIVSVLVPQLASEVDEILRLLPQHTKNLEGFGQDALRNFQRIPIPEGIQDSINLVIQRIQLLLEGLASRVADLLVGMVSQLVSLVISPFLAFYLLRDLAPLKRHFYFYIPNRYRKDIYYLAKAGNKVLNGFIRGQLVISLLVGLLIAAGLAIVGIRYALFIGFIAGLFNIIPYFGPIIGFIPTMLLALLKSPMSVFWVLLVFLVVNQIEATVLAPKIIGERVGLHPLAVIFAVLAGGELMGIMGMLIAVPVAAIIRVFMLFFIGKLDNAG